MFNRVISPIASSKSMLGWVAGGLLWVSLACAAPSPAAKPELNHDDALWLQRVTYGLDTATVEQFRLLGKSAFLEQQLGARDERLPPNIQARIDGLSISHERMDKVIADFAERRRDTKDAKDNDAKLAERKQYAKAGVEQVKETSERELLRAIYSPAQLKEQMVWFWLNHFSVFARKGPDPWLVSDYSEHAIRPHALGNFRDLVMATVMHPAMLVYLDNARNAFGRINENYARELMELHTLGVDGGYTQRDVQELARILTGLSIDVGAAAPGRGARALRIGDGAFAFYPARHDYGDKVLLGHTIHGRGFGEIEEAVDILVRQTACAHFISRQLAEYFVADNPPPALVEAMAQAFERSDGDIAIVLRTMFTSREFAASLGGKFKDPMHFVVSALRLAYDGNQISDLDPAVGWLNSQGELFFAHQSPDGYALAESGWASSGQLAKRFEIARAIGSRKPDLTSPPGGSPSAPAPLADGIYAQTMHAYLSPPTLEALTSAKSPQEWNTFLLASPEFNYR